MAATEEWNNESEKRFYVFYCIGCRAIFGDSLAMARMNTHLESVSLDAVTEFVTISQESETSINGEDKGSTYTILECTSCHRHIGRIYETTPRKLDRIRDLYTLELSKVQSYQLGECLNTNIKPEIQDADLMLHSMVLSLTERVRKLEDLVEEVVSDKEDDERELDEKINQKKRKMR